MINQFILLNLNSDWLVEDFRNYLEVRQDSDQFQQPSDNLFEDKEVNVANGVITFGLILRITDQEQVHRSVIVTACQTLVVFTTVGLV